MESPVDNCASNSQVDASCESIHGFRLAFSVRTVKEWLEVGENLLHLIQLRFLLINLRSLPQPSNVSINLHSWSLKVRNQPATLIQSAFSGLSSR